MVSSQDFTYKLWIKVLRFAGVSLPAEYLAIINKDYDWLQPLIVNSFYLCVAAMLRMG